MTNGESIIGALAGAAMAFGPQQPGRLGGGGGGGRPTASQRRDRMMVLQSATSDAYNADFLTSSLDAEDLPSALKSASRLGNAEYNQLYNLMITEGAQAENKALALASSSASVRPLAVDAGITIDEDRVDDPAYWAGVLSEVNILQKNEAKGEEAVGRLIANNINMKTGWNLVASAGGFADPAQVALARDQLAQTAQRGNNLEGSALQLWQQSVADAGTHLDLLVQRDTSGALLNLFGEGQVADKETGLSFSGASTSELAQVAQALVPLNSIWDSLEDNDLFDDTDAVESSFPANQLPILAQLRADKEENPGLSLFDWVRDPKRTSEDIAFIRDLGPNAQTFTKRAAHNKVVADKELEAEAIMGIARVPAISPKSRFYGVDWVGPDGEYTQDFEDLIAMGISEQFTGINRFGLSNLKADVAALVKDGVIPAIRGRNLIVKMTEAFDSSVISSLGQGLETLGVPGVGKAVSSKGNRTGDILSALEVKGMPGVDAFTSDRFDPEDRAEIRRVYAKLKAAPSVQAGVSAIREENWLETSSALISGVVPVFTDHATHGIKIPFGSTGKERAQSLLDTMGKAEAEVKGLYGAQAGEVWANWERTGRFAVSQREAIYNAMTWEDELDPAGLIRRGEQIAEQLDDIEDSERQLKDAQGNWISGSQALHDHFTDAKNTLNGIATDHGGMVMLSEFKTTGQGIIRGLAQVIGDPNVDIMTVLTDLTAKTDQWGMPTGEGLKGVDEFSRFANGVQLGEGYKKGDVAEAQVRAASVFKSNILAMLKPSEGTSADTIKSFKKVMETLVDQHDLIAKQHVAPVRALMKAYEGDPDALAAELNAAYSVDLEDGWSIGRGKIPLNLLSAEDISVIVTSPVLGHLGFRSGGRSAGTPATGLKPWGRLDGAPPNVGAAAR